MIIENLSTLKIYKLTQEQYEQRLKNNEIDRTALYFTDDDGDDVGAYIDAKLAEILPTITENDNGKVLQVVNGKLALVEI